MIVRVRKNPLSSKTFNPCKCGSLAPLNDSSCANRHSRSSAKIISLGIISSFLFMLLFLQWLRNLNIHTVRRNVLGYDENFCKYQGTSSVGLVTKLLITLLLSESEDISLLGRFGVLRSSSMTNFSSTSSSSVGHFSGGCFNHAGPSHHFDSKSFLALHGRANLLG